MENVRWFLQQNPEFESVSVEPVLCEELKKSVKEGCLQLLPVVFTTESGI